MKDELNNYNIDNSDGKPADGLDSERQISFSNDEPNSVVEDFSSQIDEWDRSVSEDSSVSSSNHSKQSSDSASNDLENSFDTPDTSASSSSTTASSSASSAAASTASASAAVGSSIGVLAGVVTTTVVATLVIVVAFISTMLINVSLSMAEMTRLVFQVEIKHAQEEDFETPIYAALTGEDGYLEEQEIHQDTVYLTFEGLEPGREYSLKVYNGEKVFFNKSFLTATKENPRGSIDASLAEGEAIIYVSNVNLEAGEYYTLTVKNAEGNVIFVTDSVETTAEYRVKLDIPQTLYYSISINGAVCAITETEPDPAFAYDLANGTWNWQGNDVAEIVFASKIGKSPLVIAASVTKRTVAPGCETEGQDIYTATVNYLERTYSDTKSVAIASVGHTYGNLVAATAPGCETEGSRAYYHCEVCGKYFDENKAETTEAALAIPAINHNFVFNSFVWTGYTAQAKYVCSHDDTHIEYHDATITSDVTTEPTCEGTGIRTYTASYDGHTETKEEVLAAIEHEYLFDSFVWTDYTAQAKYICSHDDTHVKCYDATITNDVTTEPTCEGTGIRTYTASYDGHTETKEEVLAAIEHEYLFDSFVWTDYTAQAKYVCSHDDTHIEYHDATITNDVTTEPTCEGTGIRTYTASYDGHTETKEEVLAAIEHEYLFDSFVWTDYTAQAKYVCSHDNTHVKCYDAVVTYEDAATTENCEETTVRTYTATYDGHSDTKEEVFTVTKHDYVFDSFEWSGYTAKAKYVCSHDSTHVEYYDAVVTNKITTAATCEKPGIRTYTATYDGHTGTKTRIIEVSTTHNYVFDSFEWNDDYTAQAKYVCADNSNHVTYYNATVTIQTNEEQGIRTYTASYDGHTETIRAQIEIVDQGQGN